MSMEVENLAAASTMMGFGNLDKNTTPYTIPGQVVGIGATLTFTTTVQMPKAKCFAISYFNLNGVTYNNIQDYYFGFAAINDSQLVDNTNGVVWEVSKSYSGNLITVEIDVVNNLVATPTSIPTVNVTILTHFFDYPWN